MKIGFVVSIWAHCLILATIMSVFFRFLVARLSRSAIEKELRRGIRHAVAQLDSRGLIPGFVSEQLLSVDEETLFAGDAPTTTLNNHWLFNSNLVLLGALWSSFFVSLYLLGKSGTLPNMWELVKENVAVFLCVGIVELTFFTQIALHFVPAPPSLILTTLVDAVKKRLG